MGTLKAPVPKHPHQEFNHQKRVGNVGDSRGQARTASPKQEGDGWARKAWGVGGGGECWLMVSK